MRGRRYSDTQHDRIREGVEYKLTLAVYNPILMVRAQGSTVRAMCLYAMGHHERSGRSTGPTVVTIQHLHVVVHASSISCFSCVSLPTITACLHSLIDPFNFFVKVKWSFFRAQCTLLRPELRVPHCLLIFTAAVLRPLRLTHKGGLSKSFSVTRSMGIRCVLNVITFETYLRGRNLCCDGTR